MGTAGISIQTAFFSPRRSTPHEVAAVSTMRSPRPVWSDAISVAIFCAPATSRNRSLVRLTLSAGLTEAELAHVEWAAAKVAPLVKPWEWPIARRNRAQATQEA